MTNSVDKADIFTSEEVINDPYSYFDELRSRCPIHEIAQPGVLAVTGYDEAVAVYRNDAAFSSCNAMGGPFPPFPVEPGTDDITDAVRANREHWVFHEFMVTKDGADHDAERSLLRRLMTPKRLKENEDQMAGMADACIDAFIGDGRFEVVQDYGKPFTTMVIADLLGVPAEDRDHFRKIFTGQHVATLGGDSPLPENPLEYMYETFGSYIEERRRQPREDVLTALATSTYPDGTLPDTESIVRLATFLFGAGQDTSARLMASSLRFLAEDQDLQAALRADRGRIPEFVEEVLRLESPTMSDFRMTQKTTCVGGVDIPAGTTIMLHPGASNRDPRKFPEPEKFRLDRENVREHIAFGRGVHSCPGGPLARAEGRVTIERFLDRTTSLTLSEEHHGPEGARTFRHDPTYIIRGLTDLHLCFTAV
ncbi:MULTISPECIES: cytochrome P450 [Mycobacterium]|uniref:Cytochrome n=1 Tax=Mycobacterium syngnathidarum TaxID=1908205 RepID=A0A1Q9W7D1_9MYCO|nr:MULTISPECIES: cytochrome P450 [Mycobacterium]MCG7609015.1 cytochrome P450 [Mycobacterium sp. CnD-18-1]OHT96392.1 cytochrome [Mycobacterium syngnathidarum]OLT93251.1 cytochrome [Mycobacterium syngnathidarum]